ncbi:MAG: hypothetical protein ABIC19_01000 [Patescibacteria group bacterium]|nr:hypothetical protein [Patescibacteria group bacterium]
MDLVNQNNAIPARETPKPETRPKQTPKQESQPAESLEISREKTPAPQTIENQKTAETPPVYSVEQIPAPLPGQSKTGQTREKTSEKATPAAAPFQKDQSLKIHQLLELAAIDSKKRKQAIQQAKKTFKNDPHSLDEFHDRLLAQNK